MSYPNTPWYSRPGPRIRGYTAHVGDPDNETKHPHPIWFRKDTFTLVGKTWRKATPENEDFIKSLEDYNVPAEFKEPGSHEFLVVSAEKLEFPFPVNLHPPKRVPIKIDPRECKPYKRGRRVSFLKLYTQHYDAASETSVYSCICLHNLG